MHTNKLNLYYQRIDTSDDLNVQSDLSYIGKMVKVGKSNTMTN